MSKNNIKEECKPVKLVFTDADKLVVIPTIGDGNCFFHSILRAFNVNYIEAKSVFDRVNIARTFRNGLADRLLEVDPLTGKEYYYGLNNCQLEEISKGVREYTKEYLRKELLSSQPVDNIYQELISDAVNTDIYIIDAETKDVYNLGTSFSLYYKGRNSIVIYYSPGHFEVIGVKRSNGDINTLFTPTHSLIQSCRERLIENLKKEKMVTFAVIPSSPHPIRTTSPKR